MEGNREPVAVLAGRGSAVPGAAVADVACLLAAVRPAPEGAGLIGQLRELEDLKSAAAALQARIAVAFEGVSDCLCRRAVAGRVIGESLWL
jgi:hypothetical protein